MGGDTDNGPGGAERHAVEARGLTKRYGEVTAVDGVDLRVPTGRVHGLLGPNGAGKTTLLRMLFGLIKADTGTLSLLGRTSGAAADTALDGVAGFVESPTFYPYLSGRRNLQLLADYDGMTDGSARDEVIEQALVHAGLLGRDHHKVGGYSLGMRQRLGIAAALLRDPQLLILDEPSNGLDPAGLRDIRRLIRELADNGLTVLVSSHNMAEVETLCDSVTIMRTGRVVYDGTIDDLRAQAPAPSHRLRTSDDPRTLVAAEKRPGLSAVPHPEGGLSVRADQDTLDAFVIDLASAGTAIRGLALVHTPLETLFAMFTEDAGAAPDQPRTSAEPPPEDRAESERRQPAGTVWGATR